LGFLVCALIVGLILLDLVVVHVRVRRRHAFQVAMSHVVRQLSGRLATEASDLAEWLNWFWAGPYELTALEGGTHFMVATLDVRGFPTAIVLDPYRLGVSVEGMLTGARLQVLVAGWETAGARQRAQPQQVAYLRSRLQQMGYGVTESGAGLCASADPRSLAAVRRYPATLHVLTPVATTLTYLAEALGREPATARS
jgi:hypothetical protein